MNELVKTGLARFEYVHYVIFGAQSEFGAVSTECGADHGYFWEFHDAYFGGSSRLFTRGGAIGFAESLGIDGDEFAQCIDDNRHAARLRERQQEARADGVNGTPTVFVNGVRVGAGADAIIDAVRSAAGR